MRNIDIAYKRAVLVYIYSCEKKDVLHWNGNLTEFSSLAISAGLYVINIFTSSNRVAFNAKYLIGMGKALELKKVVYDNSISVVLFNQILSARQERNLIHLLQCIVMDRNKLIFNIFAQRARTYEGKLQVELAQLHYLNSRLTHEWSHLERQRGGIGLRGGPGEMQLESDRRVLRKHIVHNLSYLKKIKNQREQSRKNRFKMGIPIISLVGYTNAGKSTLFNILTASHVYTSEKLFATLDPTFRRIVYQKRSKMILVDTVGFIQNLPNDLISSFSATLKETMESTLLLHIIDASSVQCKQNINTVNDILNNIKINDIPVILVMNKIDKLNKITPRVDRNCEGHPTRVWISAKNNLGISLLMQVLDELLSCDIVDYELRLPMNNNLYQKLYQLQVVKKCWIEDDYNIRVRVHVSTVVWNRLLKRNKSLINYIV